MEADRIEVGAVLWWDCGEKWRQVRVSRVFRRDKRAKKVGISWTDRGQLRTARVSASTLRRYLPRGART